MEADGDTLRHREVIGGKCKSCGYESWLNRDAFEKRFGNHYLLTLQQRGAPRLSPLPVIRYSRMVSYEIPSAS
jgi:hypothetical protein